jgi:hypothetical protein
VSYSSKDRFTSKDMMLGRSYKLNDAFLRFVVTLIQAL